MKKTKKKTYLKPYYTIISIDNTISIQMISETGIPDSPPWVKNNLNNKKTPYREDKA